MTDWSKLRADEDRLFTAFPLLLPLCIVAIAVGVLLSLFGSVENLIRRPEFGILLMTLSNIAGVILYAATALIDLAILVLLVRLIRTLESRSGYFDRT